MSKIALDKINELVRADLKEKMGDWVGFATVSSVQFGNQIVKMEQHPCTVTVTCPKSDDPNDFLEAMASFDNCAMPYVETVVRAISADITNNLLESWNDMTRRLGLASLFVFQRVDSYHIDNETIGFKVWGAIIDSQQYWYSVQRQG